MLPSLPSCRIFEDVFKPLGRTNYRAASSAAASGWAGDPEGGSAAACAAWSEAPSDPDGPAALETGSLACSSASVRGSARRLSESGLGCDFLAPPEGPVVLDSVGLLPDFRSAGGFVCRTGGGSFRFTADESGSVTVRAAGDGWTDSDRPFSASSPHPARARAKPKARRPGRRPAFWRTELVAVRRFSRRTGRRNWRFRGLRRRSWSCEPMRRCPPGKRRTAPGLRARTCWRPLRSSRSSPECWLE